MIVLPRPHRATDYTLRPVSGSRILRGMGALFPSNRPGDKFSIEVDVRALGAACGQEMVADLLRASGQSIRVPLPLGGIDRGATGRPVVDGAGQSGSVLSIKEGQPQAVYRKGWTLHVETAGELFTYMVAEETILDADGKADLPIWPMMPVPHADGDRVEMAEPMLEGLIDGGVDHTYGLAPIIGIDSFVIEPRR